MHLRQNINSNITDIGIKYMANNCHYLRKIDLQGAAGITDKGLYEISQGCKNIQLLGLGASTNGKSLTFVDQKKFLVTDVGLEYIAETCHSLNMLNVRGGATISDIGVVALAKGCPLRSFYANTNFIVSTIARYHIVTIRGGQVYIGFS